MFPQQTPPSPGPLPDINELTDGLSPTQTVIVVVAVAVIVVLVYLVPRLWPDRPPQAPTPPATPADTTTTTAGPVVAEVQQTTSILDRLVEGLERQLAAEVERTKSIEARYEQIVEKLRDQLAEEQKRGWQMSAEIADLQRQLGDVQRQLQSARDHVVTLQAQLGAVRPPPPHGIGGRW